MSEPAAELPMPAEHAELAASAEAAVTPGSTAAAEHAEPVIAGPSSAKSAPPKPPPAARSRANRAPGVTGRGVIALILVATALAGLVDMAISGHRGHLFGIVFAITSTLGALVVRRRDLSTAVVAPPILYCLLIMLVSLVDRAGLSGGLLTTEAFYLGNAFVTGAPAIWCGTALACGIGWYRSRR